MTSSFLSQLYSLKQFLPSAQKNAGFSSYTGSISGMIWKNQRAGVQQSTTVSSLWADTSHHHSYQSAGSFSDSEKLNSKSSASSTLQSLKSLSRYARTGIRNSAFSDSPVGCFQRFSWCMACYESKVIAVEPIVFVVMLAIYFQKIVFELYAFNWFSRIKADGHPINRYVCYSIPNLNNASLVAQEYSYYGNWNNKTGDVVEAEAGILIMTVGISSGILSVIGTLLLGPFSNRLGRKPALVTIIAGMVLQAILTTIIIKAELNVYFFVLAFAFRSLTGGVAGIYTLSYSYVTEVSGRKKKWYAMRIGCIELLSFLAVSLGFMFGGLSIDSLDCNFEAPAYICAGCLMTAFIYALIATPESYDDIFAISTSEQSPLPRIKTEVFTGPKPVIYGMSMLIRKQSSQCKMWLSLLLMMVTIINSTGMSAIITLFLLNEPLAWSPLYIGSYLGTVEFVRGLVLVVLLPWLLSSGMHDITIITLSMLLTISMNVALGFMRHSWQLFLVGIGQSSEVLIVPTLKAVMSKSTPVDERGALFSFVSVAQLLSTVLGYAIYVPIYIHDWHYRLSVATPFFVMAGVYVFMIPLLCALGVENRIDQRRHNSSSPLLTEDVEEEDTTPSTSSVEHVFSSSAPSLQEHASDGDGGGKGPSCISSAVKRRPIFEASIGQDVAWIEQSYSSLSEYHSNR